MDKKEIEKQLNMTYIELTQYLQNKYGKSEYDYFRNESCSSVNPQVSRTSEGLFCHHIDEDKAIELSSIKHARNNPYAYQKADRLVYCNILEHLIMHIKISLEPRHKEANENQNPGFGGVKLIASHISDYFNGYEFKRKYLIVALDLIKENFDEYIKILKSFIYEYFKHLIKESKMNDKIQRKLLHYSFGIFIPRINKVYQALIKPDEKDMIPIEELNELEKLAEEGDLDAQIELADLYNEGLRVSINIKKALIYYEMAAFQGDLYSIFRLGFYYFNIEFSRISNREKALEYFLMAANLKDDYGQYIVGYCYFKGQGIEEDLDEAIKWFKLAAEQEMVEAQLLLGDIYYKHKRSAKKNTLEAIKWYELAYEHKEVKAAVNLAKIYAFNQKIENDLTKAKYYYEIAKKWNEKAFDEALEEIL